MLQVVLIDSLSGLNDVSPRHLSIAPHRGLHPAYSTRPNNHSNYSDRLVSLTSRQAYLLETDKSNCIDS